MELKTLTPGQLYAFEQLARRERALAQARLLKAFGQWVSEGIKTVLFRPYAPTKGVRHA